MSSFQILKTENEFEQLLQENKLSVINFGASWCSPCKILFPQLEQLSKQASFNNVNFGKIMIDDESFEELVGDLKITSVPTTLIYYGKSEIYRCVGATGAVDNIKKELMKKLMEIDTSDNF
jgi:thioredoxin 1